MIFRLSIKSLLFLLLSFLVSACGPTRTWVREDAPVVWKEPPKKVLPEAIVKPKKMETIVIDAGHGGKDTGTQSEKNHYQEKQLTLLTARLIQQYLAEMGYKAVLTRDSDTFVELASRAQLANSLKAHLFVSIHYNYCESPEAAGIEVYYYKDEKDQRLGASKRLGEEVLSRIVKHTGAQSRGTKTANFAVIRETTMPAILIEGGFLSNPEEREKVKDPQYRCYLAWSIARGIQAFLEKS